MEGEFGDMRPSGDEPGRPSRRSLFGGHSEADKERMRRSNNPHGRPTGDCTGRCRECGSSDLWTDNLAYGCNNCGALLGTN